MLSIKKVTSLIHKFIVNSYKEYVTWLSNTWDTNHILRYVLTILLLTTYFSLYKTKIFRTEWKYF